MFEIKITVSGPGGVINYEMEVIKKAFESLGREVNVVNSYPEENIDEYMEKVAGIKRKSRINLVADHEPWGG